MKKLILLSAFILMTCASESFAETWIHVGYDYRSNNPIMLDTDSIKRSNGSAFFNVKLPPIKEDGPFTIVKLTMDCVGHDGRRWHKVLEFTTYSQEGIQLDHWYNLSDKWKPIYPHSVTFTISDFACSRRIQAIK